MLYGCMRIKLDSCNVLNVLTKYINFTEYYMLSFHKHALLWFIGLFVLTVVGY